MIIRTCNSEPLLIQVITARDLCPFLHNQASPVTVISALSDSAPSERYQDQARCCAGDDRIAFARILRAGSAAGDTAT